MNINISEEAKDYMLKKSGYATLYMMDSGGC